MLFCVNIAEMSGIAVPEAGISPGSHCHVKDSETGARALYTTTDLRATGQCEKVEREHVVNDTK